MPNVTMQDTTARTESVADEANLASLDRRVSQDHVVLKVTRVMRRHCWEVNPPETARVSLLLIVTI